MATASGRSLDSVNLSRDENPNLELQRTQSFTEKALFELSYLFEFLSIFN
ncbi:hypothetical protein EV682_102290 [Iodobacter fluviatilis]|uniref:Uncharacterized protein n=1 Tax=Iodobacter fluviatilis TaxID=537 RepID=A0A377Q7Q5_9NEIS|nr:hypothetical protein EV682_102290 [Iodobacter fluviatilis]STQ90748.1 Uncharacterised protein [Iodobacter fluviatilis]